VTVRGEIEASARGLSEGMATCLAYWPQGHFTGATRRALARRGLVRGEARTELGEQVLAEINRKD
jgi:hypothetical protein